MEDEMRPPGTRDPPDGGFGGSVVPDEAPPLLWLLLAAALALWWLWPWLEKWRAQARPPPASPPVAAPAPAHAAAAARAAGTSPGGYDAQESENGQRHLLEADAGRGGGPAFGRAVEEELGFDLAEEFQQAFTGAAGLIGQALSGPPSGKAYTAANAALHHLVEILDRAFQAFGSQEELAKVTRLREASDAFGRSFGEQPRHGGAMRELLRVSGFERRCASGTEEGGSGDAFWVLPHAEASARLHGLTVRLCLQKFKELQRIRGPGRWLHQNNDAVVPKLEDAAFAELVDLYTSVESSPSEPRPSMRERNLETNIRMAINQRRVERGLDEAMSLHKGLAGVARSLADAQRVRARTEKPGGGGCQDLAPLGAEVAEEIRSRVASLPLPPGFSVAHLHWSSNELPRLFGLASTKGGGGKEDAGESSDQAADILSNEAVGYWAVRQECDMFWPAAMICGVGAALDYTVNKGFVVALLLGFEPPRRQGADGDALQGGAETLRRRPAAATAARKRAAAPGGSGAGGAGSSAARPDAPPPRRVVGLGDFSRPSGGG